MVYSNFNPKKINFLPFKKYDFIYFFIYEDGRERELRRIMGKFALSEMDFSFYDVSVLVKEIEEIRIKKLLERRLENFL